MAWWWIDNIAREKGITLYWEAREKNYPAHKFGIHPNNDQGGVKNDE